MVRPKTAERRSVPFPTVIADDVVAAQLDTAIKTAADAVRTDEAR